MPTRDELFERTLNELSGEILVTTSVVDDLGALASGIDDAEIEETVSVLVDAETAKQVRNSFVLASQVVDLVAQDALEVRSMETRSPFSSVLIGTETIRSVVAISDSAMTGMEADADEPFLKTARDAYLERWAAAETLSVRAPPYSRMLGTLGEELGEAMRADIEAVFEAATDGPEPHTDIDPVQVALLLGGKHEIQFYELGLWGESEGVASRAKFSREKQTLEEHDLLETKKIPIDIGRPRQRLILGSGVDSESPEEIFATARSELTD